MGAFFDDAPRSYADKVAPQTHKAVLDFLARQKLEPPPSAHNLTIKVFLYQTLLDTCVFMFH